MEERSSFHIPAGILDDDDILDERLSSCSGVNPNAVEFRPSEMSDVDDCLSVMSVESTMWSPPTSPLGRKKSTGSMVHPTPLSPLPLQRKKTWHHTPKKVLFNDPGSYNKEPPKSPRSPSKTRRLRRKELERNLALERERKVQDVLDAARAADDAAQKKLDEAKAIAAGFDSPSYDSDVPILDEPPMLSSDDGGARTLVDSDLDSSTSSTAFCHLRTPAPVSSSPVSAGGDNNSEADDNDDDDDEAVLYLRKKKKKLVTSKMDMKEEEAPMKREDRPTESMDPWREAVTAAVEEVSQPLTFVCAAAPLVLTIPTALWLSALLLVLPWAKEPPYVALGRCAAVAGAMEYGLRRPDLPLDGSRLMVLALVVAALKTTSAVPHPLIFGAAAIQIAARHLTTDHPGLHYFQLLTSLAALRLSRDAGAGRTPLQ